MANDDKYVRFVLDAAMGSSNPQCSWRAQPVPFKEFVIEDTVPFTKFKNWKTKGKKKLSQFLKKRMMQLSMDRKSSSIEETKEGSAVISYGIYGPGDNLQY